MNEKINKIKILQIQDSMFNLSSWQNSQIK